MKKTLVIAGGAVLILLIVGGAIYFLFGQKPAQPTTSPRPRLTPSPKPTTAVPTAFKLLDSGWVVGAGLHPSENRAIYFDRLAGTLKSIPFAGGSASQLSGSKFENVVTARWEATGKKVLFEFITAAGIPRISVFDIEKSSSTLLEERIREAAWNPDGTKLLAHRVDGFAKESFLATINPDGSGQEKLIDLAIQSMQLFWPASGTIFVLEKPAPGVANMLLKADVKTGTFQNPSASEPLFGTEILPSADGKMLLVTTTDNKGAGLTAEILDAATGGVLRTLPVQTLVSKCAWTKSSEVLYCAFPTNISFAGVTDMPFSYARGEVQTKDAFGKFNLKTGEWKIFQEGSDFDATNVLVSPREDYLIFINRGDQSLYSLRL